MLPGSPPYRVLAVPMDPEDLPYQGTANVSRIGEASMYRLRLLGGASLEGPDGPLVGAAAQRQRLALLAFLALSPASRASRDKLLAVFWPESEPEKARHALSNAIYALKRELGEEALMVTGDELGVNLTRVSVDAVEFLDAAEEGTLEVAASLYLGPLLDGLHLKDAPEFERWTDDAREELARAYADVLERLAVEFAKTGETRRAVDAWRKLAALDPYDARIALELMAALEAAGNRAAAIQHASVYTALMEGELEAAPDPAVLDFAERLKTGASGVSDAADSMPAAVREKTAAEEKPSSQPRLIEQREDDGGPRAGRPGPELVLKRPSVLSGLHENRLVQWSLAYLAGVWFTLQLMDVLADPWGLTLSFQRGVVILLALGFPVAVALAWYRGQRPHPTVRGSGYLVIIVILGTLGTILAVLGTRGEVLDEPSSNRQILRGGSGAATGARPLPSVAVLPFDNISPDPNDAYLADGIHEELLTQLSKISGLIVISRGSTLAYRNRDLPTPEIARDLNVGAIVEGSVQKAGNEIRITAQLIDGDTDAHLWGERYDRALTVENLFQVQTEIALRIAEQLQANLTPAEEARIARLPTSDLEAFELYLRGNQAYLRYQAQDNARAIELFHEAVDRDPSFAMAWAGLGNAYAQGVLGYGLPLTWADSAEAASRRAIELEPEGAEGHKALGLALTSRARYRSALASYMEALQVDPNHPSATANVGVMLMRFGSLDESLLWTRRTLRVAPDLMLARANLAWNYLALEEWDLAEEWARETTRLAPEIVHGHEALAFAASAQGRLEEGLRLAEEIVEVDRDAPARWQFAAEMAALAGDWEKVVRYSREALDLVPGGGIPPWHFPGTTLGYALIQLGQIDEGRNHLSSVRESLTATIDTGSDDPRLAWEMGCVLAAEGALAEAVEWLERGFEEGWRWATVVELDPVLGSLRDTREFIDLQATLRFEVEAMRRRAREGEEAAGLR